MTKRNVFAVFTGLILTAALATAQIQPAQMAAPPAKHHHKVMGLVMFAGGVGLIALGAFTLTQPCPAQDRAQQIASQIGIGVAAGSCGSSWLQKDKTVIGASVTAAGAALVVSSVFVMRHSEHAEGFSRSVVPPASVVK